MSRVGKMPIAIPQGVDVAITENLLIEQPVVWKFC